MADPGTRADRLLVGRCLAGEPGAWEEFVRIHGPVLRAAVDRILRRFRGGPDPALAEELTQEALGVLARLPDSPLARFRWDCPLPYYLAAVASQRALRYLRSRQANWEDRSLLPLLREISAPTAPGSASLERSETGREVVEALRKLPDRQRLALKMHYWHDFPVREIGSLLGISGLAARQLLSRGREGLRRLLRSFPCLL